MPESVTDRPTKAHEYVFLFSKRAKYFYDHHAVKEPSKADWGTRDRSNGKYHNKGSGLTPHSGLSKSYVMANKRTVWNVATKPYPGVPIPGNPNPVKEYAAASGHSNGQGKTTLHRTRPVIESSFEPACACGCSPVPAVVLDPFAGSGTTLMVARRLGRAGIGLDLSLPYLLEQARPRLLKESLPLPEISGGALNSLEHHQRQTRLPLGF